MSLSLDSIYQPFNAFFANKFAASATAPIKFRFAHLPRALADSDFLVPGHADLGPSPALAAELFSGIVDGVPTLDEDGKSVWVGPQTLSDLYGTEMLAASQGWADPAVTDPNDRQAAVDAFNAIKHDAKELWETIVEPMSLIAAGASYRAANSMPAAWWDKSAAGIWTSQSFHIEEMAPPPVGTPTVNRNLLRLRMPDAQVTTLLQAKLSESSPMPARAAASIPMATRRPQMKAALNPSIVRMTDTRPLLATSLRPSAVANDVAFSALVAPDAGHGSDMHARIAALPFRQRIAVEDVMRQNAPMQPVAASSVDISFDFCVVSITRPWLDNAFLRNASWYVPGLAKGALSANDGHGLPVLPVGFVAVKNLSIRAAWTAADISNLVQSVQFGPFNFDSNVVDGTIAHAGIQVVGWLLQDLPTMPPNAAPGSSAATQTTG